MARVSVRSLVKQFGSAAAVAIKGINLEIEHGEIRALLGPSGCGKTTTLRCIAGLEAPTSGEIRIGDRVVYSGETGVNLGPERRGVGVVFQSYALWPHMTVFENVAYGLRVAHARKSEIEQQVSEVLALVGLQGLEKRHPGMLSGGQQQRVALARSLVSKPGVILLDEPLSNLDPGLRERMRGELRDLIKRTGQTAIYVTHDPQEAMVVSDRISLITGGLVVEEGPPREMYEYPARHESLQFLGPANYFTTREIEARDGWAQVKLAGGIEWNVGNKSADRATQAGGVAIRPEKVLLSRTAPTGSVNTIKGVVKVTTFLGQFSAYLVDCGGIEVRTISTHSIFDVGEEVFVRFPEESLILLS